MMAPQNPSACGRFVSRRTFIGMLAGSLVAAPLRSRAQSATKVYRIAWLHLGSKPAQSIEAFRRGLNELGWIEGRNIVIEVRWAENKVDRLTTLAAELVAIPVDIIVTQTTPAALAAKQATALIPIVMAGSNTPVQLGLVKTMARPGGNVTGMTNNPGPGFVTKMVQLLQEVAPRLSRLAVLERAGEGGASAEIRLAAATLSLVVINAEVNTPDDVPIALALAIREQADGLFVAPSPANDVQQRLIVDFTLANRLPSIGGDRGYVQAGGLMSYWTDWDHLRRRTAWYVDRILRGANPGDLPVEQPSKFELVLNRTTAKALGLTIPSSLLMRADELLQ